MNRFQHDRFPRPTTIYFQSDSFRPFIIWFFRRRNQYTFLSVDGCSSRVLISSLEKKLKRETGWNSISIKFTATAIIMQHFLFVTNVSRPYQMKVDAPFRSKFIQWILCILSIKPSPFIVTWTNFSQDFNLFSAGAAPYHWRTQCSKGLNLGLNSHCFHPNQVVLADQLSDLDRDLSFIHTTSYGKEQTNLNNHR